MAVSAIHSVHEPRARLVTNGILQNLDVFAVWDLHMLYSMAGPSSAELSRCHAGNSIPKNGLVISVFELSSG